MPDAFIDKIYQRNPRAEIFYNSPVLDKNSSLFPCQPICFDEELFPFAWNSFDLILSNLTLHWVNDVPGVLTQVRYLLKSNGLFLASILGEKTLQELKFSFLKAESLVSKGINPHFSPLIDLNTASHLLLRAGFALPVSDCDRFTVMYPDPLTLMRDLRGMGENNALTARSKMFSPRQLFLAAAEIYLKQFQTDEGLIPATFDILYLTGWNDIPQKEKG